jgi:hypothetical protein
MSASSGAQPEEIAGIAVAAVAMTAGVSASVISDDAAKRRHHNQLMFAEHLLKHSPQLGVGTEDLQRLQIEEMKSRFKEYRYYSRLYMLMLFLFAVIFLLGGVYLILGVTTAHVLTVLASAIPGVSSALFKYASNAAVKRSDEAFHTLTKRVEDAEAVDRRAAALARVQESRTSDTLEALEAIKSIVPNATPEQLASIVKSLPPVTGKTEIARELPEIGLFSLSIYCDDITQSAEVLRNP